MAICRQAGYRQFVSHWSGEAVDTFLADLAVGSGCGHLKPGGPARGERGDDAIRAVDVDAKSALDPVVGAGAIPAWPYLHQPWPDRRRSTIGRPAHACPAGTWWVPACARVSGRHLVGAGRTVTVI
jgi:hypothetical protein